MRSKNIAQDYLGRMYAETFATDSYQNILFSILLFNKKYGCYPSSMTIVTHAFKTVRFMQIHLPALHWSPATTLFKGIDPPENVTPRKVLEEGETKNGLQLWGADPYGMGEVLSMKREGRGWSENALKEVYETYLGVPNNKEKYQMIKWLMRWKGGLTGRQVFPGRLPWNEQNGLLSFEVMKGIMDFGVEYETYKLSD